MIIKINDVDYTSYLLEKPSFPQRKSFSDSDIIVSAITLIMDNSTFLFSHTNPKSIFYGLPGEFYNANLKIYNDDNEKEWEGLIRTPQRGSERIVNLSAASALIKTAEEDCIISVNGVTPAQACRLLAASLSINTKSFGQAATYQSGYGIKINLNYAIADGKKNLELIKELAYFSNCSIYELNGTVYLKQNKPYAGEGGVVIDKRFVISNSVSYTTDDRNIINSFSVKPLNSPAVEPVTGSDSDSIGRYSQNFPYSADYSNATGITLTSVPSEISSFFNQKLKMQKDYKNVLTFYSSETYSFLKIGDIIHWTDENEGHYNEPFEIFEKIPNKKSRTIQFVCYDLNISPKQLDISKKTIPPSKVKNFIAVNNGSEFLLYWNLNAADENIQRYIIYYGEDIDYTGIGAIAGSSPVYASSVTSTLSLDFQNYQLYLGYYYYLQLFNSDFRIAIAAMNTSGVIGEKTTVEINFGIFADGAWGAGAYGSGAWGY